MYAHIARGIPNNWFTRKIVKMVNKYLSDIKSIYRIEKRVRYRKSKSGRCQKFSVYIRITREEFYRRCKLKHRPIF
jgi:hypothetical protein